METTTVSKATFIGAICAIAVSVGMLLYAILGEPEYGFFGLMKIVVSGTCVYCAFIGYSASKYFIPMSLILAGLAYVEFFEKMRREQWVPINWATVAALSLTAIIFLVMARKYEKSA